MILEFADKSQLEVLTIFGGPVLTKGVMRDTLRIEVDPSTINLSTLSNLFQNKWKCMKLYTYDTDEGKDVKTEIGEGYCIFLSCQEENREVLRTPGKIYPSKEYKKVYIVSIAQYDYKEWSKSLKELETSTDGEARLIWRYLHE